MARRWLDGFTKDEKRKMKKEKVPSSTWTSSALLQLLKAVSILLWQARAGRKEENGLVSLISRLARLVDDWANKGDGFVRHVRTRVWHSCSVMRTQYEAVHPTSISQPSIWASAKLPL